MPSKLTVGVAQAHTQKDLSSTLGLLRKHAVSAASKDVSILLFPEAFLGGYPRTCNFGAAVGSRSDHGRQQFLHYYRSAVDLGDSARGEGDAWMNRTLEVNKESGRRGDGTREYLEDVARDTGVFIVTGCVEKAGGSLYCAVLFVDPKLGVIGKRRKVQPTGSERLVWAQGQPSSLKAIATTIRGVRVVMGCAICWENYMPLLRYSLYAQEVNLWLAPTADARATWEPLMRTVAAEGRCWVVSGNQCVKTKDLPDWVKGEGEGGGEEEAVHVNGVVSGTGENEGRRGGSGRRTSMTCRTEENHEIAWKPSQPTSSFAEEAIASPKVHPQHNAATDTTHAHGDAAFASAGGSLIVDPFGNTVVGPVWNKDDELLRAEIDFEECERGRFDLDVTGHYGRLDAFRLEVEGLELVAPP